MTTPRERAGQLTAVLGRGWRLARPALGWLGRLLVGLGWSLVYAGLRLLEASKRAAPAALVVALLAGWAAVRLAAGRELALYASLVLAAVLMYGWQAAWTDFRDWLLYLSDAHPENRALHLDGRLAERGRRLAGNPRELALAAVLVVVACGLLALWPRLDEAGQTILAVFVLTVATVIFAFFAGLVALVERQVRAAFYVRGWRLAEPAALEARWLERLPALAWRGHLTAGLAPLAAGLRWLLRPPGECAAE